MNNPLHLEPDERHDASAHEPHTADASIGLNAAGGWPEHHGPVNIVTDGACEPLGQDEIGDEPYGYSDCTHAAGDRHG